MTSSLLFLACPAARLSTLCVQEGLRKASFHSQMAFRTAVTVPTFTLSMTVDLPLSSCLDKRWVFCLSFGFMPMSRRF